MGHANLLRDDEAALTPLENRIECYGYDHCSMTSQVLGQPRKIRGFLECKGYIVTADQENEVLDHAR